MNTLTSPCRATLGGVNHRSRNYVQYIRCLLLLVKKADTSKSYTCSLARLSVLEGTNAAVGRPIPQ